MDEVQRNHPYVYFSSEDFLTFGPENISLKKVLLLQQNLKKSTQQIKPNQKPRAEKNSYF